MSSLLTLNPAHLCPHPDCAGNYITPAGATLSTTYSGTYSASNCITNGTTFCHSGSGAAQWLQIDLGAVYSVGRVTVNNRASCCQNRIGELYPFRVSLLLQCYYIATYVI